jgi:crossover junction endodeoxyribonuclease RuvC
MRVMGIDPGSRFTGYGILDWVNGAPKHVDNGVIVLPQTKDLASRLAELSVAMDELLVKFAPTTAAVEKVFTAHNVRSALVLAQARGVILASFGRTGVPVHEYSASEVKTSVAGYGRAEKAQMQKMTRLLLGLHEVADVDASDALAIGICHLRTARLTDRAILLRGMR